MNPSTVLDRLPGVGHYDFLVACTEAGRAVVPPCKTEVPQADTHRQAITQAENFSTGNSQRAIDPHAHRRATGTWLRSTPPG